MKEAKNIVIEYTVPLLIEKLSDSSASKPEDGLLIEGTAVDETISRNNIKYTSEELKNAAASLNGKPILKDHSQKVGDIVGRVSESHYDEPSKSIKFKGKIMDKQMQEMIKDGRIQSVSIGARVSSLIKEAANGIECLVAKGLDIMELSLVAVAGVTNATLQQALHEQYDAHAKDKIEEKIMEESKMAEESKELQEKLKAYEDKVAALESDKTKLLTEKMATEKNFVDVSTKLSEMAKQKHTALAESVATAKVAAGLATDVAAEALTLEKLSDESLLVVLETVKAIPAPKKVEEKVELKGKATKKVEETAVEDAGGLIFEKSSKGVSFYMLEE